MNYVNTVTGPVAASELGRTLMHEHFLFGFCGFQGDATLGGFKEEEYTRDCLKAVMMPAHTASTRSLTQQQTNADVMFVSLRRSLI